LKLRYVRITKLKPVMTSRIFEPWNAFNCRNLAK
jgi:hypothetical protein